jgi:hypothetical protein
MRNEDDLKETDPHYREMLKVIIWHTNIPCFILTVATVSRCPKQLVFGNPSYFYCHVTCHYLQDRFDFAMVNFLLFSNPLFLTPTLHRWGFLVSLLLAVVSILFFGALYAITGMSFIIQPFIQVNLFFLEDYIIVQ